MATPGIDHLKDSPCVGINGPIASSSQSTLVKWSQKSTRYIYHGATAVRVSLLMFSLRSMYSNLLDDLIDCNRACLFNNVASTVPIT